MSRKKLSRLAAPVAGAQNGLSYHILPVAATMTGVCVTVITLFRVTNTGVSTLIDEALAIDAFLFILACFISYRSIANGNDVRRERLADRVFFIAMLFIVIISAAMAFF